MKKILPPVLAALVIGIGLGWLTRGPGPVAEKSAGDKDGAAGRMPEVVMAGEDSAGEETKERAKSGPRPPREPKGRISPDAKEMVARIQSSLDEQRSKKIAARISGLVAKLGLNPQQEARLKAHLEGQKPEVAIDGDEGGIRLNAKQTMSPKEQAESLDKLMKEMLTADQHEAYEANKEAERNQRIEARTLRDMASLTQAVSLREDQRDAVYEILQNEARGQVDQSTEGGMQMGAFMNAEFAAPAGAEATVVQMNVDGPVDGMDHEQIMGKVREQEQARIDRQVERLSGVLDATQLAAYRSHLEQGPLLIGP